MGSQAVVVDTVLEESEPKKVVSASQNAAVEDVAFRLGIESGAETSD